MDDGCHGCDCEREGPWERSYRATTRRQSFSLPNVISERLHRLERRLSYLTVFLRCFRPEMQARTLRIKIAFCKMEDLKPYAENAGTQSDKQIQQVAASIWQFNFVNRVLINSEDCIVAGHGRVAPARKLG